MKKIIIITLFVLLAACGGPDSIWFSDNTPIGHNLTVIASGDDTLEGGFWGIEYTGAGISNVAILLTYPDAFFDFDINGPAINWAYGVETVNFSGDGFYGGNANRPTTLILEFYCTDCSISFGAETDYLLGHPGFTNGVSISESGTIACAQFADGQSACANFDIIHHIRSEARIVID